MRKNLAVMSIFVLFMTTALSGCGWFEKKEQEQQPVPEVKVAPSIKVSDDYYSGALPYLPNKTKGSFGFINQRIDITRLELGLMELAQGTFDPKKFLFQEGQVLEKEDVNPMVGDYDRLLHVLEHNYLYKENGTLAGVVMALSLRPYQEEDGHQVALTNEQLRETGKELAAPLISQVRAKKPRVPMLIALYTVESESSLVPGHFIAVGNVPRGETMVSEWKPIDEKYYVLPGEKVREDNVKLALSFDQLQEELQSFFSKYMGLVGTARMVEGRLAELTLTATAEYDSKTEAIQFAHYAVRLLPEYFGDDVHVNFYIQTIDRPLALYVRPAEGEGAPFFHVYRNQ